MTSDYIQKTDLTEKQRLLLEQLSYSAKSVWVESEKKEGFSISYIAEHNHTQNKLVNKLLKEFRLP